MKNSAHITPQYTLWLAALALTIALIALVNHTPSWAMFSAVLSSCLVATILKPPQREQFATSARATPEPSKKGRPVNTGLYRGGL